MLEYIALTVAVIALSIASYTDLKHGTISNRVTYPAVGIGIVLNAVIGILDGNFLTAISGVLGAAVLFGFGYAVWILKQLGGGDVGMFTAVGALLPNVGAPTFPLLGFPIVAVCLAGAFTLPFSLFNRKPSPMAPLLLGCLLVMFIIVQSPL